MSQQSDRNDADASVSPPPADPKSFEEMATIAAETQVMSAGIEGPIPSAPTGDLPRSIGHYRILRKLGEGGMGIVYEAEQQNPRRRVALKVIRGGRFVDDATIRMFRREAETLARLRHPNIGAIYESGRTEEGQHFFAMELVQGDNLDGYLAHRPKPTTSEEVRFRLALFRRIAEAVHYAHMRGVIHRDLKPTNIIISEESNTESNITTLAGVRVPDLKILDFGLARITEGDVQATKVTEVGVIKGTLPYMSPEQARGTADAIDVRTDVYALGVILYEMLTSSKPYDVSRSSLIEAVRVICEEPPRSLRSTMSGRRRLDPDIETIVGKALEKDANRRYASAAAMAEDVDRYLASQPILARPPSTVYQLRKFAGRNRTLVAGIGATLLVLIAGIVVSSWQAVRATRAEALAKSRMARAEAAELLAVSRRREADQARSLAVERQGEAEIQKAAAETSRERADLEASKARAINRFLEDMLATADPWAGGGEKVTLDAALERAQSRIGSWAGNDPEVDYAIRMTLSQAFAGVGKYAEADSLLRGGIDQLSQHSKQNRVLIAGLQRALGGILSKTAQYDAAGEQYQLALANQTHGSSATSDTVAMILSDMAASMAHQGRYFEADSVSRKAMRIVRKNAAVTGLAAPTVLRTQAYIEANWKENYSGADEMLRQSVSLLMAHAGDRGLEASEAIEEQAGIRVSMGDLAGADSLYNMAVSIRRDALGDNHPLTANALENQGELLYKSGRLDQTIDVMKQVLAIRQRGLGPDAELVGRTWLSLAPVYARANQLKEADAAFTTGIGILKRKLGERHPDLAGAYLDYADLRIMQRRYSEAEKLAREGLAIRMENLGPNSARTVDAQVRLAGVLCARHSSAKYTEAEALLLGARNTGIVMRGDRDPGSVKATQQLVQLYDDWKKPAESEKYRALLPGGASPGAGQQGR